VPTIEIVSRLPPVTKARSLPSRESAASNAVARTSWRRPVPFARET